MNAKDVLEALFAFAENPEADVASMSRDEVRAYLDEEGLNVDAHKTELKNNLQKIRETERDKNNE